MKKEELAAENAALKKELSETLDEFNGYSKVAIKNLARALGLSTTKIGQYGMRVEINLEWSDIYVRIGRLRTLAEQKDQIEQINFFNEELGRQGEILKELTKDE